MIRGRREVKVLRVSKAIKVLEAKLVLRVTKALKAQDLLVLREFRDHKGTKAGRE